MSEQFQQLVLTKLGEINVQLAEQSTNMKVLLGSEGRKGLIPKMQQDIEDLQKYKNRNIGYMAGAWVVLEAGWHLLFKK